MTCTCRKGAWNPDCARHGRATVTPPIDEKRRMIAEARAYNEKHAGTLRDEGPLPELYPGHYEDLLGVPYEGRTR